MKFAVLWIHILSASTSLPLLGVALFRQMVTRRAVPRLRRASLVTFGLGMASGVWLTFSAASIPRACLSLTGYALLFVFGFGFLWGEDPRDCPYLNEQSPQ